MNISSIKNLSFTSKNPKIRNADDFLRQNKRKFPMIGDTQPITHRTFDYYIEHDIRKAGHFERLLFLLGKRIESSRKKICDSEHTPIQSFFKNGKNKIGNCGEQTYCLLEDLRANQFFQSYKAYLTLSVFMPDRKDIKKQVSTIDHALTLTTFDKDNRRVQNKKRDFIVIDPWAGFVSDYSGAITNYKKVFGKKIDEKIAEFQRINKIQPEDHNKIKYSLQINI